jgi:hypothetical protein
MRVEMEVKPTQRGFWRVEFTDRYGAECSLQKSSLATEDAIWLGVDKPFMAESLRMHLTQDMVKELLPLLQHFAKTGELPAPEDK